MKKILIYRHPDCEKCARYARFHQTVDWLDRISVTTATPRTGPLRLGEIVVENLADHKIVQGVEGLQLVFRQVVLYWPLLPLLWVPWIRKKADQDVRGLLGQVARSRVDQRRPPLSGHPSGDRQRLR